ncbi:hypothetical protein COO91_10442 (plasmid) [Nostoc flagelliforme CCNUN1]|uniref:Uncharacterized protein n=1 Tax=Nostoc flagelliforme CCNUN1 TaxID=2038116 RepID=A0A2K8T988_9NOSO|nr:hypothetical protein [Nostoc flagelliforme]AUB44219.1 hypothetical protein COO91_10442 [Nostoc flagelliforme CCNUN1]
MTNILSNPKKELTRKNVDESKSIGDRKQLEALVFQKLKANEDVTQALSFLSYLQSAALEPEQHKRLLQEAQEKSVFGSLQRVLITAFAILGMITFFDRVFNARELSQAGATPPATLKQH